MNTFLRHSSFKQLANKLIPIVGIILLTFFGADAFAESANKPDATVLDKQLEDLKTQALDLNRDLKALEEDLLFPANTQVAVFLSMNIGTLFQLDSVELKIDDAVVTHYLYTDHQIDALKRGGVQRLWVGNLKTGKHDISAFFIGYGPNNREYKRAATLQIQKEPGTKLLELKIVDNETKQQPDFKISEWK